MVEICSTPTRERATVFPFEFTSTKFNFLYSLRKDPLRSSLSPSPALTREQIFLFSLTTLITGLLLRGGSQKKSSPAFHPQGSEKLRSHPPAGMFFHSGGD